MQFGASNQVIQDDYNGPSVKTKFKEIVQTAYQASKADNKLFLNHISATSLTFTPRQYAAALNNKVEQFVLNLTSEKSSRIRHSNHGLPRKTNYQKHHKKQ